METKEEKKTNQKCCLSGNWLTALLLILAGGILLANNFNFIPWNIWAILWKFWPVILIIWGLEAISGKKIWSRIIVLLIGIFLLFFIAAFSVSQVNSDFNNWLKDIYPQWEEIEKQLPDENDFQQEWPEIFKNRGKKVFRCDPVTGDCKAIYK